MLNSIPAVGICIPAYKAERFLLETLESVRAQSFRDWEIVVVEDGSRDGTQEMVERFAKTVPQSIRYVRHDPNRGLPATRNHAIEELTAPWIALLDADDLWHSDHLDKLMARAERDDADVIHAGSQLFDSDTGKNLELRTPSPWDISAFPLSVYVGKYLIQPSSVLLRKSLWQKVGGFCPEFRYVEDREMWLRCARAGGRFAYNGAVTCRYRKHGASLSQQSAEMAIATAKVCEQHVDWDALPKSVRCKETAEAWTSAGRIVMKESPQRAAEYFRRALRHRKFAVRLWVYWSTAHARSWKTSNAI